MPLFRRLLSCRPAAAVSALLLCATGLAQQYTKPTNCAGGRNTTSISGVVYSPNGKDPLPDVLVYVPGPSGAVKIPDGVTTVDLRPTDQLTESTTAYDGSFTLTDAPAGTAVPLVLQSGKWQRQLVISSVTACQDNVPPDPTGDRFARFPKNKSEGYIPHIAIVTGSVETTECVLRKVGMDDAEFTNFTDGGRINLYVGGGVRTANNGSSTSRGGSSINSSTPGEATLMTDTTQLNSFDLLLFACQGADQDNVTTTTALANFASFVDAGGRAFINHHSHAWLKGDASVFTNTFNWAADNATADAGPATIDQTFTIGATLAAWLQNLGATTTLGQISVTNVFASLGSLGSNAQLWIDLNSNKLPIQASFDTPVGAGAGKTYGRVLYNEYHVSPVNNSTGSTFPNECTSGTLSTQEKVLEFSLFDLSTFAAIVKVDPQMTLTGTPNPAKLNAPVTVTATLATPVGSTYPTPTGAVTFSEGGTTYGTVVVKAGIANTTLTGLAAGTHTITASYAGDPYYNSYTATTTVTVYPAATVAVAAQPNPVYTGHTSAIVFAASAGTGAPTPTGTVAITVDGITASYPLTNGTATAPAKVYTNGPHAITAVYSGDTNFDSQTATTTLYVQVQSSSILSEAAPSVFLLNPAVFTATANGASDAVPSGTYTFSEGTTVLGTAALVNGSATLPISTLSFGQHTITAAYSGDNYYGPSTSSSVVENVMDYTLTLASGSTTIPHSGKATFTFTLTPLGGTAMPAAIAMNIINLRPGSTLTFSPASVAAGSGTVTVTATIQTAAGPSVPPDLTNISRLRTGGKLLLALLVVPVTLRSRRRMRQALLLLLAAATLIGGISGCGTGWKTLTYGMTLTTSSGALTHNSDLTLTETGGN